MLQSRCEAPVPGKKGTPGVPPFARSEPQSLNQPELTHHSIKQGIYEISKGKSREVMEGRGEGQKKKINPNCSELLKAADLSPPLSLPPGTGLPSCYNKPPAQRLSELKYPVTMATEPCTRGPRTQFPKLAAWQGLSNVSTSFPCASSLSTPGYTSPEETARERAQHQAGLSHKPCGQA